MKKIINGKRYDTETATLLLSTDNGLEYRDFGWCEEDFYKKKTGEFFLHGQGGPMTEYATCCGNSSGSGEEIVPLTTAEAKRWLEKKVTADEYEEIFGAVEE